MPNFYATFHTLRKFVTNFYAILHTFRKFMTNFYAFLHTLRKFMTNFYATFHTLRKFMTNYLVIARLKKEEPDFFCSTEMIRITEITSHCSIYMLNCKINGTVHIFFS